MTWGEDRAAEKASDLEDQQEHVGEHRSVAISPQLLKERSRVAQLSIIAAGFLAVAVLFVLLLGWLNSRHINSEGGLVNEQKTELTRQAAEIAALRSEIDQAKQLETDVATLKQQLRDKGITPNVPDRAPLTSNPTTSPTTAGRSAPTSPPTTGRTSPTTSPSPPATSPPTTSPPPSTTTTTTCVVNLAGRCVPLPSR